MAKLFQVGVGSGGMPVLDALARDPRITSVVLFDPDDYQEHNVERHIFGRAGIGRPKTDLAVEWLRDRRPDLQVESYAWDICDPKHNDNLTTMAQSCDIGVCAADNEPAKFLIDSLMRRAGKPWTLGEVLSGGIGGLVHRFVPGGPCYGCVASYLQRSVAEAPASPLPDYAAPQHAVEEARIPASKAAIATIAGFHALITLDLLDNIDPGFTTLLLSLKKVDGVFADAYRPHRFVVPKLEGCLVCGAAGPAVAGEELDVALDQAFARLGDG
jgi:molybdopterin/thiamine biosynthesis adenylyltransferase